MTTAQTMCLYDDIVVDMTSHWHRTTCRTLPGPSWSIYPQSCKAKSGTESLHESGASPVVPHLALHSVPSFCFFVSLAHHTLMAPGGRSYHGNTHIGTLHCREYAAGLPVCGCEAVTHRGQCHVPRPSHEEAGGMGEWASSTVQAVI